MPSSLPEQNNVYGHLQCAHGLSEPAKVLRYRLGLGEDQVHLQKSQFDGSQRLHICSERADFEIYRAREENAYLFSGAVAGTEQEVCDFVRELHAILDQNGYPARFEIYNPSYQCIAEFP